MESTAADNQEKGFISFPEDAPEEIQTQFRENFEKFTGRTEEEMLSLVAENEAAKSLQSQFDELSESNRRLKGETSKYQLEDPVLKKVVDLAVSGASKDDIQQFFKYQNLDVENMSDRDVLVEDYIKKGSNRRDAEILANEDLSNLKDEEDEVDPVKRARLTARVNGLKAELGEMKVSGANPEILAKKEADQLESKQLFDRFKEVSPQIASTFEKIKIPITTGDNQVDELEIELPSEVLSTVAQSVFEYGVSKKLESNDPELLDHAKRTVFYYHGDKLIESAIKSMEEKMAAKYSNVSPPPTGDNKPPVPGKGDEKAYQDWKANNVGKGGFR